MIEKIHVFCKSGPYFDGPGGAGAFHYECSDCDWKYVTVAATDPLPETGEALSVHANEHDEGKRQNTGMFYSDEEIALVAFEADKVLQFVQGSVQASILPWSYSSEEDKETLISLVNRARGLKHPHQMHEAWCMDMFNKGRTQKEEPRLVGWPDLPQKVKDQVILFFSVVKALNWR